MGARVIWLGLAAVALLLLYVGSTSANGPRAVFLVGDSIGVGLVGPLTGEAVRRAVPLRVAVRQGATAGEWRARVASDLGRGETLVLSLGTNDCKDPRSRACERFPDRARAIGELARQRGGRALWLVPTWVPWAQEIRINLRAAGQTAIELGTEVELQPDGIHPTAAGYRTLAARVAPLVM